MSLTLLIIWKWRALKKKKSFHTLEVDIVDWDYSFDYWKTELPQNPD